MGVWTQGNCRYVPAYIITYEDNTDAIMYCEINDPYLELIN